MIVMSGGSASGKSKHAEDILCRYTSGRRLYLATMEPTGQEAYERIDRHRQMRQSKGFETLERYRNLQEIELDHPYDGILVECMSNLLANEMFGSAGQARDVVSDTLQGMERLKRSCCCLVIVTNEIFSDGRLYTPEIIEYMRQLGKLNCALAQMADAVAESVCGLLLPIKGEQYF